MNFGALNKNQIKYEEEYKQLEFGIILTCDIAKQFKFTMPTGYTDVDHVVLFDLKDFDDGIQDVIESEPQQFCIHFNKHCFSAK